MRDPDADFCHNSTAYHEAGHAVIALHFNRHLERATVRSDCIFLGHVLSEGAKHDLQREDREQIIVLYAGYTAEFHDDVEKPDPTETGAEEDELRANRLLGYHPELDKQELRREASNLVQRYWRAIEDVAEALLEEMMLTGEEVEVVAWAHKDNSDWRELLARYRETGRSRDIKPKVAIPASQVPSNRIKRPWWQFWGRKS